MRRITSIATIFIFFVTAGFSQDLQAELEINRNKAKISYERYIKAIRGFISMRAAAFEKYPALSDLNYKNQQFSQSLDQYRELSAERNRLLRCLGKQPIKDRDFGQNEFWALRDSLIGRWEQPCDTGMFYMDRLSLQREQTEEGKHRVLDYSNRRCLEIIECNDKRFELYSPYFDHNYLARVEQNLPRATKLLTDMQAAVSTESETLRKEVAKLKKEVDCIEAQPDIESGFVGGEFVGNPEPKPEPKSEPYEEPKIMEIVEQKAMFPGGNEAMLAYLQKHLKIPDKIINKEIGPGKVYVRFVVSTKGTISNVTVVKGYSACPECSEEALRVVKQMPKWTPAQNNGQVVNSWFNLPIRFGPE